MGADRDLEPVPNQPPSVVSGPPTSATVTPQTFTFTGGTPTGTRTSSRCTFR